jgi:hypothetical protein
MLGNGGRVRPMTTGEPRAAGPAWFARRLRGLRKLLKQRVRVKCVGKRLQFVFDAQDAPSSALSRAPAHARPEAQAGLPEPSAADLACMHGDLADMLDFHPTARLVFPSLVQVERALGRRNGQALHHLPAEVLEDASKLLARLVGDWSSDGLSMLRARLHLLQAVSGDEAAQAGETPEVDEGSLSLFMELDREWDRQLGLALPAAAGEAGKSSAG